MTKGKVFTENPVEKENEKIYVYLILRISCHEWKLYSSELYYIGCF